MLQLVAVGDGWHEVILVPGVRYKGTSSSGDGYQFFLFNSENCKIN